MAKVRTRFAPSPTGYMHIGNLRTALYEYLIAKHDHGDFIFQEWLPIVAASQSVKGKEEEREFLLSWVNVCDYQ